MVGYAALHPPYIIIHAVMGSTSEQSRPRTDDAVKRGGSIPQDSGIGRTEACARRVRVRMTRITFRVWRSFHDEEATRVCEVLARCPLYWAPRALSATLTV